MALRDEWIMEIGCIYTMGHCSVAKKKNHNIYKYIVAAPKDTSAVTRTQEGKH